MTGIKRTVVCAAIGLLLLAPTAPAQVSFSGDARFRPRLDLDDRTEDPAQGYKMSRFYYMYRLRLDMTGAIGEGYYVKSRLSHNGIAYYARGGTGDRPEVLGDPANPISEDGAARPGVDFMYLYLGRSTPTFGFDLGLVPVPGFVNPLWDLHYYPDQMVDIPYLIWNNDGAFGAHAYRNVGPGRLTMYGLLDRAIGENRESTQGVEVRDNDDQYTVAASYSWPIGRGVTIAPMVLKTFGASIAEVPGGRVTQERTGSYNAPLTIGGQLTLPVVGPLTPTLYGGWTRSSVDGSLDTPRPAYDGWLARFKLQGKVGPGTVLSWVDVARRSDDPTSATAAGSTSDFFHVWLNYNYPLYSGERGSFVIGPEWRIINVGRDDLTMRSRHKIELNVDVTFR